MANSNYQEPIEKQDLDLAKKLHEEVPGGEMEKKEGDLKEKKEIPSVGEKEAGFSEQPEEKVSEKLEATRKAIGTQPAQPAADVADDAKVAAIAEFEKKVEKLVEIADPERARNMRFAWPGIWTKEKIGAADNYTLDEIPRPDDGGGLENTADAERTFEGIIEFLIDLIDLIKSQSPNHNFGNIHLSLRFYLKLEIRN